MTAGQDKYEPIPRDANTYGDHLIDTPNDRGKGNERMGPSSTALYHWTYDEWSMGAKEIYENCMWVWMNCWLEKRNQHAQVDIEIVKASVRRAIDLIQFEVVGCRW